MAIATQLSAPRGRRALRMAVVLSLSAAGAARAQPEEGLGLVATPRGELLAEGGEFVAVIAPDGSVTLRDRPNLRPDGIGVTFDVTDALMRSQGMDPYASAKLALLDDTRDVRVAMGREYRSYQLAHADELMRANIDAVYATVPDPAQRKQALFALWDECAESGDPALVAAGAAARAVVEHHIRQELTGAEAYTAHELAALNARRTSATAFAPYADRAPSIARARRAPPATSRL